MKRQNRARLKLVSVFLLFLAPLALSFGLYYGLHGIRPGGATNKGILLTPAQPLPEFKLVGPHGVTTSTEVLRQQWTFLQVAPDGCGEVCRQRLKKTYKVWLLLHNERERVQRVLLVGAGQSPDLEKRPRLEVYHGNLNALRSLIKQHSAGKAGTVYLVDPHANWVLYYPPAGDIMGLYQDTDHLLELSHIG